MSCEEVQGSLKEALYDTLGDILSSEQNIRHIAEQRLVALEVTEEFGIHLTEFITDSNGPVAIRQLASVLLKQYVEYHWSSSAEKFRPPELKLHVKDKIKTLLPLGLHETISKVRTAVAYTISRIAHWEWPENWPGLFDILVNCLSGENEHAIQGAMRVLSEFTRDLTDTNLPNVGPIILQEMYRIIQINTKYSIRTRGRAVEIFTTIASLVAETGVFNRGAIEQHLLPIIPMFCENFVQYLNLPSSPNICDNGLKTEIIKSINCLSLKLSKYMTSFLPQILPSIWITLTQSAKIYQEEIVNMEDAVNIHEVDSDGEVINFNNLIIVTFEFISILVDHEKYASLIKNFLSDIMYYLILFMQVTDEQIELWTNNPHYFIEEDDQYITTYNVRISAQELLTTLLSYSEQDSVNALCDAITKHIEVANNIQSSNYIMRNDGNRWKMYEACIVTLSSAKDAVAEQQRAEKLQFDIIRFLDSVVLSTLNNPGAHPLLLGRCLYIGGRYAQELPYEMNLKFLEATVNGLLENQPNCIRISSIKTIYWFCKAASSKNTTLLDLLRTQLSTIFQGLFTISNQTSKEILTLILDTFSVLIPLDKLFTASVENKLCSLTIAAFLKFHSDPEILNLCQDIFKELSENPGCVGPMQTRLIPTLISMMNITPSEKAKDEGIRGVALDVLEVLVQHSPHPLSDALVESAFPVACQCILDSTDNDTLQNGGEVIRAYLNASAQQIINHRDNEGRTGLQYILQIIAQLLNPQSSEFTATFVGKLVTTLIRKAGNSLGENLDLLLRAVLSKMQRTETPTVMQSLLMIYAHLVNSEFDAVLNFLSTIPGPTGESALAFVLVEWVSKQQFFYGSYDRKVATVALCKILEYGVTHDDSRLNEIIVEGDLVFLENQPSGVKTRKKTQSSPMQWTKIPVLVKIFKLIVYELNYYLELHSADQENESDNEEDYDDNLVIDPGTDLNAFLMETFNDDIEEEKDPDIMQDSIYLLNLGQYLRDFLLNFSSHHGFPLFAQHLTILERKVLNYINIF
ncbi:importin-9 isoform X2 [Phymastichus coffea]|uniref:importin-9 isoform X2 n=1 Tax=Phymastichus coffea TaxID=108790 RepID=UPI00273BD776|nr:importin-9 isoform X2 [Phymastichus coffea]